jgi:hypothetical protein
VLLHADVCNAFNFISQTTIFQELGSSTDMLLHLLMICILLVMLHKELMKSVDNCVIVTAICDEGDDLILCE